MPSTAPTPFPDRLRHVRQGVGLLALLAVALLTAAIVLAPQAGRMFLPSERLSIRLPAEGSLGLRNGADVQVMGTIVGSVDEIRVNDVGDMEADVTIRGNFGRFIRSDSKAIIRKPLGIGDAMIEITRGHGAPLPANAIVLQAAADKAPTELLDETLREVRQEALPALHELRKAVAEYGALASDLRQRQSQVGQTLDHVNAMAESIQNGKGLSTLMNDPALADDVRAVAKGLRQSVARIQSELDQSSATSRTMAQMPELLIQAQETLRQVQRLSETAQRSWLMGSHPTQDDARSNELGIHSSNSSK